MHTLKIKTKSKTYNVIIGRNLLKNFSRILNNNLISFDKCLLLVDNKVPKKILKKINFSLIGKKKITFFLNQVKLIKIKIVLTNY